MPSKFRKSQYTQREERVLYVILNPRTKEFYIDYTLKKNVRQLYIEHCLGNRARTKQMVSDLKNRNMRPCCFRLSDLKCSKVKAYRHVIAWTKKLVENGYKNIDEGNISEYINDIFGETKDIYDGLAYMDSKYLDTAFGCSYCLFPVFKKEICNQQRGDYDGKNHNSSN